MKIPFRTRMRNNLEPLAKPKILTVKYITNKKLIAENEKEENLNEPLKLR